MNLKCRRKIIELYNSGKRVDEIADILDITIAEVVKVLEDAKLIR